MSSRITVGGSQFVWICFSSFVFLKILGLSLSYHHMASKYLSGMQKLIWKRALSQLLLNVILPFPDFN